MTLYDCVGLRVAVPCCQLRGIYYSYSVAHVKDRQPTGRRYGIGAKSIVVPLQGFAHRRLDIVPANCSSW